jgi:hexokinase
VAVRVPLQFVKPSMRLARPINDAEGRLVAGAGTQLGERVVKVLRAMAVQSVLVTEAGDLPSWETVKPLAEELRELDARFGGVPAPGPLRDLHAAIARLLGRRAARIAADPVTAVPAEEPAE